MREWLAGIVGESLVTGAMLVLVTVAVALAFVILFAIFKGFSRTAISGGRRARQARLAVMDAAAIDSKRRLVLIRRDDVEHLVLIGGPSDIVVEQNIRHRQAGAAPQRRPAQVPAARAATPGPAATNQRPVAQTASAAPAAAPSAPQRAPQPIPRAAQQTAAPVKSAAPVSQQPPSAPPIEAPKLKQAPSPSNTPPQSSPARPSEPVASATTATVSTVAASAPAVAAGLSKETPLVKQDISPPKTNSVTIQADNKLKNFEEELAMELGETIVPDDSVSKENNLSTELDELLSEMTSDKKPS